MIAKATKDLLIITFISWLMLIGVSFVLTLLLYETPKSPLLPYIRPLIGIALIGLWLFAWFKLVSSYFWKMLRKNYKNKG
ncbi:MAG: hypothetical protein QW128_01935 [Thermoprotei archaeon]